MAVKKFYLEKSELEEAVKKSKSYRETCKNLDIPPNCLLVKNKCIDYNIDTKHFKKKLEAGKSSYYKYIGKTLNNFEIFDVVQQYNKELSRYHYSFVLKCLKCDKISQKDCTTIVKERIKTCGCKTGMKVYEGKNNKQWTGYGDISGSFWNKLKKSALIRNIDFNIDIEYIWNLYLEQDGKCYYTDINIYFGPQEKNWSKTASLDRIDSTKGYVKGNVRWVHKKINLMKHTSSHEDFISLCKLVSRKFQNEN